MLNFCVSYRPSCYLLVISISMTFCGCTTKPSSTTAPATDVVAAGPAGTTGQNADPANQDSDLPPELQNAATFNPATTLDQKSVQESDFYQINKSTLDEKEKRDAAWIEQERLEGSVLAHKKSEEDALQRKIKEENDAFEKDRQLKNEKILKNKNTENDEEQKAADEVKKMPTISDDELNWKALDHH